MKGGKSGYDLSSALTYGQGTGAHQLVDFVTELTKFVHDPPYQDWKCIMTGGNTSALELAFRTFTERGTYALADEYTYATAFECANPLGVKMIGIKLDEEGPIPSDMDDILSSWDEQKMGSKKPHVLYTVPTGHNPTGSTQSTQRRQEIYNLASKHDIIILEDDPYYFLQLAGEVAKDASELIKPTAMADLLPSFLKLDVDGRVYRMDSCSKILAPGLRTGWITASAQITERIVRAHEISLQQPSGFSQAFLYKLFAEQWKMEGLFRWFNHLQIGYTTRRDALMRACEANLPKEVASWNVPKAGVFGWVRINWQLHPSAEMLGPKDIETEIWNATAKAGTLIVPGSWFQPDPTLTLSTMFFRINYASLQPELMPEATKRFGDALRESFQLK
jgi:aromatic amino acid aminotransferase I